MRCGKRRPPLPAISSPGAHLQVLFGTADGQVIVMDCHGRMLAHVLLHESDGILSMSWNYPAFLVEDSSESDTDSDDYSPPQGSSLLPRDQRTEGMNPFRGRRGKVCRRHSTLTCWEEFANRTAKPNLCSRFDCLLSATPSHYRWSG